MPRVRTTPGGVTRLRIASFLSLLLPLACSPGNPTQTVPPPGQALARTASIMRAATPGHPRVVRILFYGQSISTPRWTDQAMATLRTAYPNVRFDYRNLAIGGWSAITLERAAARDLADVYPDLVVFHVYGDPHAYERIIRTIRSTTAAEVVVQTDHVVTPVEPVCDVGLHLRWSPPPGCTGHVWFHQRVWEDYMSGHVVPELAARYRLAIEPRRQRWNAYLERHHLSPMALIADPPHPNAAGWTLMARLFTSWFEAAIAGAPAPAPPMLTRDFAPPLRGRPVTYRFAGNRLELLASGPLDGKVTAIVDGKPPRAVDGCWQTSRVSRLPNDPDWPALKQVGVDPADHRDDRWTVRVSHLNPDQTKFAFTVSNREGNQGRGTSGSTFVSRDGSVAIDPRDWMIGEARAASGRAVGENTAFTWDRHFACGDQPPVALSGGQVEQRHVVATGLAPGDHVVTLSLRGDAAAVLRVRAYRPPL